MLEMNSVPPKTFCEKHYRALVIVPLLVCIGLGAYFVHMYEPQHISLDTDYAFRRDHLGDERDYIARRTDTGNWSGVLEGQIDYIQITESALIGFVNGRASGSNDAGYFFISKGEPYKYRSVHSRLTEDQLQRILDDHDIDLTRDVRRRVNIKR